MKFKLAIGALIIAALLAGCASAGVGLRSGTAPTMRGDAPAAGSSYSSAAIHAELTPNTYFGLLFLGFFAAGVHETYRSWDYGPAGRIPPQLAADRAVAERDCSLPLVEPSANLRCK